MDLNHNQKFNCQNYITYILQLKYNKLLVYNAKMNILFDFFFIKKGLLINNFCFLIKKFPFLVDNCFTYMHFYKCKINIKFIINK